MKKNLLLMCAMILCASVAYGQAWNPTPMVIVVPDQFQYAFNGSNVDVPFTLSGKPGRMYLIINSKLDDSEKPVAVQNGFRGWHIVNGIDTTMYVSEGRDFAPGTNTYPWNGHGNEKQYDALTDSGVIPPGTYSYYIMGYDNVSSREVANSYIDGGHAQPPQGARFYAYDPQTGALLPRPLYMGKIATSNSTAVNGTLFKFTLGDDPYDATKITTTFCWGFAKGDVVPNQTVSRGTAIFDPRDYDTVYFTKSKQFEFAGTLTKWQFVPGGEAVQDLSYVDWTVRTEWTNLGDNPGGAIDIDGSGLMVWQLDGKNPIDHPLSRVIGFPVDDPTDEQFNVTLLEYYAPSPIPQIDLVRNGSETTRLMKGQEPGLFYMAGDGSCLVQLMDCFKMMDGSDTPVQPDGSGYIVWANSNGDWFMDKNPNPVPENPPQLWACVSYEPRNFNDMRSSPSPPDENGFMPVWMEFAGLYSLGPVTQDGTGIDFWRFGDDSFSSGGDNTQKKQNGWNLGVGSQYDGLYTRSPMLSEPAWGNASYRTTTWFAADSDGGVISSQAVAVEEDAPVAFSVAQNSPNPFNPTTAINFTLASEGRVSVDVFNIAGQKVDTLVNDVLSAGSHTVTWDANGFAAGVYFYTVTSGDYARTMKMTLLK